MKKIPDSLWEIMETILPPKKKTGRPEYDRKKTLEGILFVIKTGIQWRELPERYGCPSTIHGKYRKWVRTNVFERLMVLARSYHHRNETRTHHLIFDTSLKKAPFALFGGKNPTDRGRNGIKWALLTNKKGIPLFINIFSANLHDSKTFDPIFRSLRKSKLRTYTRI